MPGRRAIVFLLACLSLAVAAAPATDVAAQQRAAAFGIEVREGRRPMPGVEVRLQSEGPVRGIEPAPQLTDERGRAEFWWLTPGIWRVDLLVDGEVAYFLTVRLEGDRRADEMGAPARDADAPDLRWKFFRPSGPPPQPPPPPPRQEELAEAPAAMPEAATEEPAIEEPAMEEPAMEEPSMEEPAREAATEEAPPEPAAEDPAQAEAATPEAVAPGAAMPPPPMIPDQQPPPVPVTEVEAEEPAAAGEVPEVERPSPPPLQPAPPERGEGLPEEAPVSEPSTSEPSVAEDAPGAGAMEVEPEPQTPEPEPEPHMPEPEPEPQVPEPEMPEPEMPEPGDAEPMPEPVEPEPAMPEPADRQPPVQEPPAEPAPTDPTPTEAPIEAPAPEISQEPPAQAPQPVPPPRPAQPEPQPVEAAPVEPAPMTAPRFTVRSGAAGDCPDCKSEEIALTVERTVAPGDPGSGGDCGGGMAATALQAASRLAARAEGLGSGMPLDGGGVASYTDPGSSCQLLGVVLPPSARYRGYTYAVEAGGGAGGACYFPDACPVAGAVWPQRPVIEPLGGEARMVYGVFRNASAVALRAKLTVYYVAE